MTSTPFLAAPVTRSRQSKPRATWLLAVAALATALSAHAAEEDLPRTQFLEDVVTNVNTPIGQDRAIGKDVYAPEAVTYSITPYPDVTLSGYAQTWGGVQPGLQASAESSPWSDREVRASAHITYYVRLDGLPYGTTVPMQMLYSSSVMADGAGRGIATGSGLVRLESGDSIQRYMDQVTAWTAGGIDSDSMAGSFDFNMRAGMLYLVDLYGGVGTSGGGHATAYVDPTFKFGTGVDTTGLSLRFSEGVLASPVPEPAAAALLASGLIALALRRRRGRAAIDGLLTTPNSTVGLAASDQ